MYPSYADLREMLSDPNMERLPGLVEAAIWCFDYKFQWVRFLAGLNLSEDVMFAADVMWDVVMC